MARRSSLNSKKAVLKDLRIQLISVPTDISEGKFHREVVQKLIGLMVANVHKRGRPKKDQEGELANAV